MVSTGIHGRVIVTPLRELKWRSGPWTFKLETYTIKECTTWAIVYQLFYIVEWHGIESNVMCFNIWMGLTQSNGFNKLKEEIRLVYFRVSIFILRSTAWKKNYEQRQSFLVKCREWSRWPGIALTLVKISLFCDWSGICNSVEFSRGLLLLLLWWYLYLFSALLFRLTKIYPCKFILITTPLLPSPSSPPPPSQKKGFQLWQIGNQSQSCLWDLGSLIQA